LVLGEQNSLVTIGDFSGAFDDDPVFGAVVMLLQAEAVHSVVTDFARLSSLSTSAPLAKAHAFHCRECRDHDGGFPIDAAVRIEGYYRGYNQLT
jgi:hypothetical protein